MADLYTTLTPRLVVRDARAALAFYAAALDATPGMVLEGPDGRVLHAEFDVGGLRMSLTESGDDARDPEMLGGTPVVLMLMCDPDAVAAQAVAAGAAMVFPIETRPYGMRDGRFRDPFGHEWIVTRTVEHLSEDELQDRLS